MPSRPPVFRPAHLATPQQLDRDRGSAASRGYGRRWEKARKAFLAIHPVCACGCMQPAEEVDHIVPHRGDPVRFWDQDNWQALTKACHSSKTGRGL